jgi:hypothetical protein
MTRDGWRVVSNDCLRFDIVVDPGVLAVSDTPGRRASSTRANRSSIRVNTSDADVEPLEEISQRL